MVYYGKPSAACLACKAKKIKCDEVRPRCGQCLKYRRECGYSYTNRNDILFQDQTSKTVQRLSKPRRSRWQATTPDSQVSDVDLVLLDNPPQNADMAALTFWLDGMIVTPIANGRTIGHLSMLPKMYLAAGANSALAKATRSTCLAAFNAVGNEGSEISRQAYEAYGEALSAIHAASKDSSLRCTNDTLMAILLMLPNEALLARDKAPQAQWSAHVAGAMQAMVMRGQSLIADPVGRNLYFVIQKFHIEGAPHGAICPFFDRPDIQPPSSPEKRLAIIIESIYRLRLEVLDAMAVHVPTRRKEERCTAIESELLDWADTLPDAYRFQRIDSDTILYPDGHNLRLWSSWRCSRIWVNVLLYRCLQARAFVWDEDLQEEQGLCVANLHRMADDLAASLPSDLKDIPQSPKSTTSKASRTAGASSFIQTAITAWYLSWPLYLTRCLPLLSDERRSWFRSRLLAIAEQHRYRQALHLVQLGDKNPKSPLFVDSWNEDMIENVWEKNLEYGCGAI